MIFLKKTAEGILLAGFCFLLFIVFFEQSLQLPSWLFVFGRMHPMLLHFPIVLLLIYFVTFWLPPENNKWRKALGLLAALSAVVTAIMGFVLSLEEPREGEGFLFHKWGGIAIAVLAVFFYYAHRFLLQQKIVAQLTTIVTAVLIFFTGHSGAGLTHGDDFLMAPLAAEKQKANFAEAYAFADVVQPILKEKCGTCHNNSNKKGGLSLEDSIDIFDGGKTGPLFVTGNPDSSLMIARLLLPIDHKKHMAPKSKPQLSDEELQLLRSWIRAGAPFGKKVIELSTTDSFRMLAAGYLAPSSGNAGMAYDFEPADERTIKELNNNYRVVVPLGMGAAALSVQFYGRDGYSSKALDELLEVKKQVTELSLAKLPVTDEDLKKIKQFINLQKLNLNYTDITNKGLEELSALQRLRELSLTGTHIDDAGLQKISKLPSLSTIFVWNTRLDSAKAAALAVLNKNLKIVNGYQVEKDTTTYTLNPPAIRTTESLFEKTTEVEIRYAIKGAEIRYTLDGSMPDSINSKVYNKPFSIDSSVVVKAKAYKEGWHASGIAEGSFLRAGLKINAIELLSQPDSNYNPGNTAVLHDEIFGNPVNVASNKWFGYYKNKASILLSLSSPTPVRQVWIAVAKNPFSRMFPPERVEVWGSLDKNNMKLLGWTTPEMPSDYRPTGMSYIKTSLDTSTVKYLRLVFQPIRKIPEWHGAKKQPGYTAICEVIVN